MQNLGACCWLVHLFDACFQRFGINLTFLVGFSNFEYFRWKCCCAVRNWPNASSWPWTISRGSHALLSCLFQKKYEFTTFFVNSIAKFGNLSFQQQIPLEPMVTDCSFGTKTLLESLRIRIFFGPKLSFQIIQFKKRVALMLIESRTKWAASIQHQSKFKGLMVPTLVMEHIDLSYKLFVCLQLHICTFCCCAYIFLFIIWAASATGWWLWQRGRSIGQVCIYACLPGLKRGSAHKLLLRCVHRNEWEYIECFFWDSCRFPDDVI